MRRSISINSTRFEWFNDSPYVLGFDMLWISRGSSAIYCRKCGEIFKVHEEGNVILLNDDDKRLLDTHKCK